MNPFIEVIHSHTSVRDFKSDPLSEELIRTIVNAGQRAATSSNLQMYSVVVSTKQEDKELLSGYCGNQQQIIDAPVFLTWCADLSRLERICQSLDYDQHADYFENSLLAAVDSTIAAQTAGLAAESLGLGFCYIGAIRNHPKEIISLLSLPKLVFPLVGMTLGRPSKRREPRPRLPLDSVLFWDRYNSDFEDPLLDEYDLEMIKTGIYEGRRIPASKTDPGSDYGWREHSARRVSKIQRPHLRAVLEEIGYLLK